MNNHTPYMVVLTTAGTSDEARTIARAVVERKLAACAQIFPIQSIYEWEDSIAEDSEQLVLLKSRRDVYDELEACIAELHSYDVPEIIAMPIVAGSRAYLQWLTDIIRSRKS